jgi:nucleoside-diphosphate-sugar epimerase
MAKAGDELVNPVTGLRTVFRKTAQETSGELLQVSESYFLEPILGGEVVHPAGDVPEPFVDADDIADVAVAALTEEGHAGEIYELTCPRLLTFAEALGEIAKASGRKIRYVPISVEEYSSMLAEQDVPAEYVWLLTYLFTEVLDGRNAYPTDGVQRALGREPRDFADYAREAAATGIWDGGR